MDYDPDSREADFPRTADRDGVLDAADSCVQDDPSLVPNETEVMGPRTRNGVVFVSAPVCVCMVGTFLRRISGIRCLCLPDGRSVCLGIVNGSFSVEAMARKSAGSRHHASNGNPT